MNDTLANTEKKTAYILTLPAVCLVFAVIVDVFELRFFLPGYVRIGNLLKCVNPVFRIDAPISSDKSFQ